MKAETADIIEALLFASDRPVPLKKLAQILEMQPREVLAELDILREEKERIGSLQVLEVAGGWQIVTKPRFAPYIARLREEKRQRLSRAAFEVLAIIAYRQPATRGEVESLRGVDCAGPLQFLLEKKLIEFAGRKDAPGRPWLYATTAQFLDHFGLRDIADLPSLTELAALNDSSDAQTDQQLFNRGAMQSLDEVDARIAERTTEAEHAREEAEAQASTEQASGEALGNEALVNEALGNRETSSGDSEGGVDMTDASEDSSTEYSQNGTTPVEGNEISVDEHETHAHRNGVAP